MRKDASRFVGALLIIVFISYFVYPTPYYYTTISNGDVLVKVNRITGSIQAMNTFSKGWQKLGDAHGQSIPTPTPSK